MTAQHLKNPYRPDVDGLRALAVLPVLAFHTGISRFRGGFVGVDVFFVISGFLITQQMFAEITGHRFSLVSFYERRVRRILPALLAVLLATYVLGLLYSLPSEMTDLSKSLVAAALSVSNVYFYFGSGYFEDPALVKPLLHTWSLAVEEQFYLFWPIFLLLGHRFLRSRVLPLTVAIAVASFVASVIGAIYFRAGTFYLPFTRLWELAAGGLLALGTPTVVASRIVRNLAGACGIALIGGSVLLIEPSLPFPGLLALPPCLGAVLIIWSGRSGGTWAGRLLSIKPVVFIGTISYSLYLWHWPIVVFQKDHSFLMSGLSEAHNKLLIVGASILVAIVSWRFVEQPFRSGAHRPSKAMLFKLAAAGSLALILLGLVTWAESGFPERYTAREMQIAALLGYNADAAYRAKSCFLVSDDVDAHLAPDCLSLSDTKKNVMLLGDSHAAELWYGLHRVATDKNFLQATAANCFPTIDHGFGEAPACEKALDEVLFDFLTRHRVDNVLLAARWKSSQLKSIGATLAWMTAHGIPVTLVGPSALYDIRVPRLMVSSLRNADPGLPQRHFDQAIIVLNSKLAELARSHRVPYISMLDVMCPAGDCTIQSDQGLPLLFDREHFTAEGSTFFAQRLREEGGI